MRTPDELSAPTLDYPAQLYGPLRAMLQFAGTSVDGEASTVYPPLLQKRCPLLTADRAGQPG